MDILIRSVKQDELSALLDLYKHLNPTDAPLPDTSTLEKIWNEILTDRKINCFVADWEGNLIASCILAIVPNLTRGARPYGLIENVITHPDYRRQGVGKRLIYHALQSAWSHNCYKVMLLSGSQTKEVLQFYEKTGFKKGIKTGFVATPISD
ncbi:MAG: GNAT family N-acetyltransferase [Nostoc sp. DedVER02]|uniref:GNAT family N-acetyltransferase n=1 Tax=unclassified Nostoc TaxID=2593658 RepID=UPI002AD4A621|nr:MULTISPECIES: GNAT family N-acetyltransferase [unclassified Nostoc]MDZ7986610.1 GNAT family N-acetyltransferase [Nostoc sp. DedVER02]MDZ8116749.1 GNAT family N-acetyltransferase [Nostoc sp. DedVER01b]